MTDTHRTVLYHPLTPFFVLFCNIVASSNDHDFQLLKTVTSQLDRLADLSSSIAKLQMLFRSFIGLCESLVAKTKQTASPAAPEGQQSQEFTSAPQPSFHAPEHQLPPSAVDGMMPDPAGFAQPMQELPMEFPTENGLGMLDSNWGLFDSQPTLGWLDADFSFFDNNP